MYGLCNTKGSDVFLCAVVPHEVVTLSSTVRMLVFVLHELCVTHPCACVYACVCDCVRLFSELSHRSLRCLAGFHAGGLKKDEKRLSFTGAAPHLEAHNMQWHTLSVTYTLSLSDTRNIQTSTLPCQWQLPKPFQIPKQNKIKPYTDAEAGCDYGSKMKREMHGRIKVCGITDRYL